MKSKKTVILIPSYEPDPRLIELSRILSEMDFDVLIINDGSSEKYDPIFRAASKYAQLEGYKVNRGKGNAMKYGYSIIQEDYPEAKYIITCDGDGQHSPRDVNRTYEELEKTDQLVFGVRYFGKDVPFRSKFGNYVSRLIRTSLTGQYIADDQCGLRGFPIRYLPDLIALEGSRYEYEMNQIVVFQLKHYKIVQLPIEVIYENGNPTSHFQVIRDTGRIHHAIFKHAWLPLALLCTALTMMSLMTIPTPEGWTIPTLWCYILGYLPLYFFSIGVQSLLYHTRRFPTRLLRSSIYFTIKFLIGVIMVILLDGLANMHPIGLMALSLFFSNFLVNFGFGFLYGRIHRPGKLRKVQNTN